MELKPWEHPDFDDSPEWTDEDFARAKISTDPDLVREKKLYQSSDDQLAQAKPFGEAFPELVRTPNKPKKRRPAGS